MRLREKQQEEAGIERPIGLLEAGIERPIGLLEAGIERPIGPFMGLREKQQDMGLREKQQEEAGIERPIRVFEAGIGRPIGPIIIYCDVLQQMIHCDLLQPMFQMGLREKQQEEAGIERPIGPFMGLRKKQQEEAGIERPIGPFMGLREKQQEEAGIERPIGPFEAGIERPIGLLMGLREKQQEEAGIERPIRVFQEAGIGRPIGPIIIYCDVLQQEAEIERSIGHVFQMRLREKQLEAILNADTSEVKMIFGKQKVHISNSRSCHGTKLLKSYISLAPFFFTCAGGTGHGSDQPEHQGHSEIYPSTLNVVSNCPSLGEYMQRSFIKCADVCGSYMQDGNCAYHCMRDSSKTKLVEFCAKPKPLFDFCPEYDPVDQTIQKDMATLCNSTFSRNYYNSSDIYFCDPNNCLQLHESSMRSGATTLTTLMNGTEMNGGDSQESFFWLFVSLAAITFAVIIIGYILFFVKRGICAGRTRKSTKKRNQNGKKYVYTGKVITY